MNCKGDCILNRKRMREIQIKADEFLQNCKVIKYGIADIFNECERAEIRLVRYPIGENNILGFAQIRDEEKIVFSNSSVRLSREIFTIAHEIGHLLLHMQTGKTYVDDTKNFADENIGIEEMEANYFAAYLLMPEDRVRKYVAFEMDENWNETWSALDIARMMTAFHVSFEVVLNRLQSLEIIDNKTKSRLDNEKNNRKVTRLLQMIGGNSRLNVISSEKRIPGQYMDWVVYNYNHGVIPDETLEKSLSYFELTPEDISDELVKRDEIEDDLDALIGGLVN